MTIIVAIGAGSIVGNHSSSGASPVSDAEAAQIWAGREGVKYMYQNCASGEGCSAINGYGNPQDTHRKDAEKGTGGHRSCGAGSCSQYYVWDGVETLPQH
jgi:hypothetical protein